MDVFPLGFYHSRLRTIFDIPFLQIKFFFSCCVDHPLPLCAFQGDVRRKRLRSSPDSYAGVFQAGVFPLAVVFFCSGDEIPQDDVMSLHFLVGGMRLWKVSFSPSAAFITYLRSPFCDDFLDPQ